MSENYYATKDQLIDILKSQQVPVLGAGGGFAPIGTINFFDASVAPQGWLACDGTVYNITDYPDLATYYASVHGASNFYGGNGTTTFAVPDLRGEFLRGTGTNGHANQGSGANVGVHQDGTELKSVIGTQDKIYVTQDNQSEANRDSLVTSSTNYRGVAASLGGASSGFEIFTSRPTNTSFLICVKATVAGDANAHQYSTEEQVVGMDENGNYVYEKTIDGLNIQTTWEQSYIAWSSEVTKQSLGIDSSSIINSGKYKGVADSINMNGTFPLIKNLANGSIIFAVPYSLSIKSVTLQYTKTS